MFGDPVSRITRTIGCLLALTTLVYTFCGTFALNGYLEATYLESIWLAVSTGSQPTNVGLIASNELEWNNTASTAVQYDSALCRNPYLRKEWRTLTDGEKEAWTSAVKVKNIFGCLVRSPSSKSRAFSLDELKNNGIPYNNSCSLYDDLTYVHIQLNNEIHQTGLFLPFHRYFLWSFEQALRSHCHYSGVMPYWDWTKDARDFAHATMLTDPDPKTGLGGFGHPAHNDTVIDGAFSRMPLSYPVPHSLTREYTPYPYRNLSMRLYPKPERAASDAFTAEEVQKMVTSFQGDFEGFQSYIEGMQGAHMSVHLIMGGDLGGTCLKGGASFCGPDATWSPNEPLFWLHHGMVDKVWYTWQRAHPDNFWTFEGGAVRDLDTWPRYKTGAPPALSLDSRLPTAGILAGNYSLRHIYNTTYGNPLCYIYD